MGRYSGLSLKGVDAEVIKSLYKFMLRLRRCEEALIKEYHPADEMRCPIHFCVGQEAVPAALSLLIQPDDYLLSHHRTHGYFLARGAPMNLLFAEMYGRQTGANGGVAGSQDISVPDMNFCSGAILTGAVSIAVGVALGFQLHRTKNIAITGFGEGAADEGIFWEGINYAALHKLPVIFLCENNRYATYSPQSKRMFQENLSDRVAAFGLQTRTIFGNDVMAVRSTLLEAIEETRLGRGPFFIEAFTYRFKSHVGPEDDDYIGYRPKEELEFWQQNCPISLLEERMVENGLLTASDKEKFLDEINTEIAMAFEFAKKSPFPSKANWQKLNYSQKSPMADKLLQDSELNEFNQNQADTIPGPY
ncbi:MAG: thiamine pyrophosphate-dependent dehydrogenase E1 component subunit alpha [Candidatus Peregrinibacteria bacterium]|nr:thiamine pyrophosphate-dependent dehydrogenase E1 component subunit alpha [Candidatus Peregrinibacteria bacterium]